MLLNIITVTKDDIDGVSATLRSTRALRQSEEVRQIIVDSSADGEKVRQIAQGERNVSYIWQQPAGISAAFNAGLGTADAEWVWFLNGGDEVHPDVAPASLNYLLKQSKADAMIFEIEHLRARKRVSHPQLWNVWPPVLSWIPHPATLLRQRLFTRYGLFDENLGTSMDYELWFRFFSEDVVVDMLSIPLALYDETGRSSTDMGGVGREAMKVIRKNLPMVLRKLVGRGVSVCRAYRSYRRLGK